MIRIELLERQVNKIDARIIPLDNLSGEDLNYILSLSGGMTEEIFTGDARSNRVRKCDRPLVDIDTLRFIVIKNIMLLATVLQSNLKGRPHFDQLLAWLNETEHTHKGEMWLREVEVHAPVESEGPKCLFGSSLEESMKTAPSGGKFAESTIDALPHQDDMSDEDLEALFEHGMMDLSKDMDDVNHEKDVDRVIHEFFSPYIEGEQELLLTEEI